MVYQLADHISSPITTFQLSHAFFWNKWEARVILAIEAIWFFCKLSLCTAAEIYNVPYTTLADRMKGLHPQDWLLAWHTEFDQYWRGCYSSIHLWPRFMSSIEGVWEMADHTLATWGMQHVRKLWPNCFIQQWEELCTQFSHTYDFSKPLWGSWAYWHMVPNPSCSY